MIKILLHIINFLFMFFYLISSTVIADNLPSISINRVPDNGILPSMTSDENGGVHLIYFKREDGDNYYENGNIFYRYYISDSEKWSEAIQVSTNSFQHRGAIEKPTFTLSESGRVHVTWFNTNTYAYMYTRSNPERTIFEQERVIFSVDPEGVETSASISSNEVNVSLVWHAGELFYEKDRAIYAIASVDDGKTFTPEIQLSNGELGACACCGLTSEYNLDGDLIVAYRSAINGKGRHMQLMRIKNISGDIEDETNSNTHVVSEWFLEACPVSTNHIATNFRKEERENESWLVFETEGVIYQYDLEVENAKSFHVKSTTSKVRQKHPSLAINNTGVRLIIWGEGNGFSKGGNLKMQFFNSENEAIPTKNPEEIEIPINSIAAVAATREGSFLVLY